MSEPTPQKKPVKFGKKGANLRKNTDKSRKNHQLFLFFCAAYAYTERRALGVRAINEALTDALTRTHLQRRAGGAPSQMRVKGLLRQSKSPEFIDNE